MELMYRMKKILVLIIQKTALFSAIACRLVKWTGKHPDSIHPKHLVTIRKPWYLEYLNRKDRSLDIGCNNGQHTLRLARICRAVNGVDYDERMLALAKNEAKRRKIKNIIWQNLNIETGFPYKKEYFDFILFLDVFEHLNQRSKVLRDIHRILKKKGRLLISVPNRNTSWKKLQKSLGLFYYSDPDHKIEFTQSEIKQILVKNGFVIEKVTPVTLDTPWVGFIDLIGGLSLTAYRLLSQWRRNMGLKYPQESIGFEIVCHKS